jgi:hypothetical protein
MSGTKSWGGKRPGAGRPPKTLARCHCGKHTMARAVLLRLRCREIPYDPALLGLRASAARNASTSD